MPKAILYVESSPSSPEREDEYNDWYSNTHIPEILALPGFTAATRYRAPQGASDQPTYITIYDIDADDPQAAVAGIRAGVKAGTVKMSDCITGGPMRIYEVMS